ncbi:MAG: hypothetical protein IJ302_02830, partial [Clostridia bacterium]|nr:hypothetical protein [Clostridia bacterium]
MKTMLRIKRLRRMLCTLLLGAVTLTAAACDSTQNEITAADTTGAGTQSTSDTAVAEKTVEIRSLVTNGIDKYTEETEISADAPKSHALYMAKNEDEGCQILF